jgi:hypothetical protein
MVDAVDSKVDDRQRHMQGEFISKGKDCWTSTASVGKDGTKTGRQRLKSHPELTGARPVFPGLGIKSPDLELRELVLKHYCNPTCALAAIRSPTCS